MQQPPTNPNNPVVEVPLAVTAALLIIGDIVLLYLGKIDIGFASTILIAACSLLGINLAYKAPSPGQVAQQNAQQQNVQYMFSQLMSVLPAFANLLHSHAPVAMPQQQVQAQPTAPNAVVSRPVAPPRPQQTAAPITSMVPPPPQGASPGTSTTTIQPPVQQPFKPLTFSPLPEISMPMVAMPPVQPPA